MSELLPEICTDSLGTGYNYVVQLQCISSVSHHMHSAGYDDDDAVVKDLVTGIRDVFRLPT